MIFLALALTDGAGSTSADATAAEEPRCGHTHRGIAATCHFDEGRDEFVGRSVRRSDRLQQIRARPVEVGEGREERLRLHAVASERSESGPESRACDTATAEDAVAFENDG